MFSFGTPLQAARQVPTRVVQGPTGFLSMVLIYSKSRSITTLKLLTPLQIIILTKTSHLVGVKDDAIT